MFYQIFSSEDENTDELLRRYERSVRENRTEYFDMDEIDAIVDRYIAQGKVASCHRLVELGKRLHPASTQLRHVQAKVLFASRKYADALRLVDDLLRLESDPEYELLRAETLMKLGRRAESLAAFRRAVEDEKSSNAFFCIDIAVFLNDEGCADEACEYLEKAVRAAPRDMEVLDEVASIYRNMPRYDDAVRIFNKMLDIDPYSYAWQELGEIYFIREQYEEAIRAFDFACAVDEDNQDVWLQKGHALFQGGYYSKAVAAYEHILRKSENPDKINFLIGDCYERIDDFVTAEKYYRRAYALNAQNNDACMGVAVCLIEQEKYAEALTFLEQMVGRFEDDADTWICIAECYVGLDRHDDAIRAYNRSLERRPVQPDTIFAIGVIHLGNGKLGKAMAYFLEAEYLDSEIESLAALIGIACFLLRRFRLADYYLLKAAEKDAENLADMIEDYEYLSVAFGFGDDDLADYAECLLDYHNNKRNKSKK